MILGNLFGAERQDLENFSPVCRHWEARCRPYLVRCIKFKNRGDVLLEHRSRRRDWRGPLCVTIKGAQDTRSLTHLGFVAPLFGGRWRNVRCLVIAHGDWHAGDIRSDIFRYLAPWKPMTPLALHDVVLPSGFILRQLVSALTEGAGDFKLALTRVSFENASMAPDSISWVVDNFRNRHNAKIDIEMDCLDTASGTVIVHWLLATSDRTHGLFDRVCLESHTIPIDSPADVSTMLDNLQFLGASLESLRIVHQWEFRCNPVQMLSNELFWGVGSLCSKCVGCFDNGTLLKYREF